jgi:F-type H+-transporting ATPase subunit epsilon
MSQINIDIVTPEGIKYQGQAVGVTVSGAAGKFQIFKNHAALLAQLVAGELILIFDNRTEKMHINDGFLEVRQNQVNIMVESAERVDKKDLNK